MDVQRLRLETSEAIGDGLELFRKSKENTYDQAFGANAAHSS